MFVSTTYRILLVPRPQVATFREPRIRSNQAAPPAWDHAETRDRTGDLQIFGLTLSHLSYRGNGHIMFTCLSINKTLSVGCGSTFLVLISEFLVLPAVAVPYAQEGTPGIEEVTC